MTKNTRNSNLRLALLLAAIGLGMLGVAYCAVPLYRAFCQAFGIPVPRILTGPTTTPEDATPVTSTRTVTVRFIANTGGKVPVQFAPLAYTIRARVGEPVLTAYRARNTSPQSLDGVAVHMVYGMGSNPARKGGDDMLPFIDLQQCFCFSLQHYPAGSDIRLPLSFTVRPDLPPDVHTLTFAYTLFPALPDDPRVREHPPGRPEGKNAP